ncbi:MAG TPA: PfkB family carbohydrate kinase [Candidatus Limnocylindrales bacterium]|nr:PfkB family carbohydrate kinase [Candidatus Limnocylindrales bacterium]
MSASSILVVGSLAYDDVRTPVDSRDAVLGGAASYFSMAASLYAPVRLVGVVGDDFREKDIARFTRRGIDIAGLERRTGRSFRWRGTYDFTLDTAETINTDLGVFGDWRPRIPRAFVESRFVFLANIDPEIQLATLEQIERPVLVALDTMNYWIEHSRDALLRVIARVNIVSVNEGEARQLTKISSIVRAAREILALGPQAVVIKRGEHGALLVTPGAIFFAPAWPIDEVVDPTGAGDTFAGGFLGYLSQSPERDEPAMRRAVLHGTVCASFAVERFSVDGIEAVGRKDIDKRYEALRELTRV